MYFYYIFFLLFLKCCILSEVGAASPVAGGGSGAQSSADGRTGAAGATRHGRSNSFPFSFFPFFFPRDGRDVTDVDPLWRFFFYYFFVCHRRRASAVSAPLRSAAAASTISHGRSTGISSQSDLGVAAVLFGGGTVVYFRTRRRFSFNNSRLTPCHACQGDAPPLTP